MQTDLYSHTDVDMIYHTILNIPGHPDTCNLSVTQSYKHTATQTVKNKQSHSHTMSPQSQVRSHTESLSHEHRVTEMETCIVTQL